jgi:ubiquinone/menaquinone biosynthesis C-methylase UbiE
MSLPALDRVADAARYEVISGGVDAALFAAAGIGLHDRVLDVGCGYGATTRRAARTAAAGHTVGNDLAAAVLDQARAFAAAEGLTTIDFEQGDAQTHPFPDAGFDVAISRFGTLFFTDPATAFANIARALRPAGRLAITTVGPTDGNDLPTLLSSALGDPADVTPAQSLADPSHLTDVLRRAGFSNPRITTVETAVRIGQDAAAAAEFILGWGAFRGIVDETDPATVDATRHALTAAARPFETTDGVRLRSTAWLAHATT